MIWAKALSADFGRSFHGCGKIEKRSLFNELCEGVPKFLFNYEPLTLQCRKIAGRPNSFQIGQLCSPIPRRFPVARNDRIAISRNWFR